MEKGEYNLLTQKLLAEGYTADNHPDYVYVGRTCADKENPLNNLNGGFEYYRWHVYEKAFRTPCGLMCKGTSCMSSLAVNGAEFSFENDLATVHCPHHICDCELKDKRLLNTNSAIKDWCNVHMTDEEYQYEGSLEAVLKLWDDQIRRDKISYAMQRKGHVCSNHMYYDRDTKEWKFHYDPGVCARLRCNGNCRDVWSNGVCPVLGRELCKEKGNVYYDIKTTRRCHELDGTLFEGKIETVVKKGNRVFDHSVNMDICRNYAKLCQDEIRWKVRSNYHEMIFFAEYHGREFSVEVLNIRAEKKESRDLMQDLQDIRDGITIVHASDMDKRDKERKKEKRAQNKEKRIAAMEKKIISVGYENMDQFEQNRACKLISFERLDELEEIRQKKLKEEQEKPIQLSLFDL